MDTLHIPIKIELDRGRRQFLAFYAGRYDSEPRKDDSEVEELRFFSRDALEELIRSRAKIHPECLWGLKKFFT